jgi:hypothetical protein
MSRSKGLYGNAEYLLTALDCCADQQMRPGSSEFADRLIAVTGEKENAFCQTKLHTGERGADILQYRKT